MLKIHNFDNLRESGLFYGGQAGLKLGVKIDNENWILKFPGNIRNFTRVDMSYNTTPLSEFIGSNIFKILGFKTHDTILGIKNNKLVVACKDFTISTSQLIEFREIKNYYNQNIEDELDETISLTKEHGSNLESSLIHFKYNPLFKKIKGLEERFWETSIVDILINNNDRNSGNWGVLFDKEKEIYEIAPIYDCGGSFYNKKGENSFFKYLSDENNLRTISTITQTAYKIDGHILSAQKFLQLDNDNLKNAVLRIIPIIEAKFDEFYKLLEQIPDKYENIPILGENTKKFYFESMKFRYYDILIPRFKEICIERNLNYYDVLYNRSLHEDLENIYNLDITNTAYKILLEKYSIDEIVEEFIEHYDEVKLKNELSFFGKEKER